jgi:hypothetical protein
MWKSPFSVCSDITADVRLVRGQQLANSGSLIIIHDTLIKLACYLELKVVSVLNCGV